MKYEHYVEGITVTLPWTPTIEYCNSIIAVVIVLTLMLMCKSFGLKLECREVKKGRCEAKERK